MKTQNLRIRISFLILFTAVCFTSFAQTQPFPANKTYSFGLMPTNRNTQDAIANYAIWKTNFLEQCGNGRYRVKFDNPNQTVSEGIGYGMLLTAYAGERTLFDGLWNYYKDNRNSQGLMNWKINGCNGGAAGTGGATDSEVDAGMALIIADYQWGSTGSINYNNDARTLINAIKTHEVEAGSFVLKPGEFGGSSITNPSYFAPAYFRKFASFMNDSYWNTVANKCYEVINNNLSVNNAAGGLVSDWCTASGNYSSQASGYANGGTKYTYDAARTPWRIAVDYAWYGDNQAKTYSKKSSDFIRVTKNGSQNIVDGYNQNGSNFGQYHNSTFVGAFASAAIAGDNQTHLNNSYTDLIGISEPYSYYNQTLKTIYLFFLSGNFYLPGTTVVNPPTNTSLVSGAVYKIIGKQSGKSVDVKDVSNANGANIQQWSYGGGANQKWRAESVANGSWKLISLYSGKCIEVGAYSNADGGNIQQWDYVNHSYQQWNIESTGDGAFKVINLGSAKAMDAAGVSDGANIQQWSYGGGDNQKWLFERVDGIARETITTIYDENSVKKVFPNPTTGMASIEVNANTTIQIFNTLGKIVYQKEFISEELASIDINNLNPGIYSLKTICNGDSKSQKLIIQR